MGRTCEFCGKTFEAQRARFCSNNCRARKSQAKPLEREVPPAPVEPLGEVSGLVDAVRKQLESAEVLNTVGGQHAIEVATRIVNAPGMNAGVASLSKELSRLMSEVLNTSTVVVDPLDEIAARRAAKLAAAAG